MTDPTWFGFVWSGGRWGVQLPDDDEQGCTIVDELGARHVDGDGWATDWQCIPYDEVPDAVTAREPLGATFANAVRDLGIPCWCPLCGVPVATVGAECAVCRLGAPRVMTIDQWRTDDMSEKKKPAYVQGNRVQVFHDQKWLRGIVIGTYRRGSGYVVSAMTIAGPIEVEDVPTSLRDGWPS